MACNGHGRYGKALVCLHKCKWLVKKGLMVNEHNDLHWCQGTILNNWSEWMIIPVYFWNVLFCIFLSLFYFMFLFFCRSVTTLRVHMKSHLEVKDIPCPYCDETFPQRHVLHQHLVNDHEESSNLTCPVCQKVRDGLWRF